MPVNLPPISTLTLHPVAGVRLGWAKAGIKYQNRKDVLLVDIAEGSAVSGVFTLNRYCAPPVTLCRKHLTGERNIRALLINTGNANAGTGSQGMHDAQQSCKAVAALMDIQEAQVLPFSTGVILEPLPISRIVDALPQAKAQLCDHEWEDAAEAIMTTDTAPKAWSSKLKLDEKEVTVTGISKGSGMIHPNMATMLSYIATDANIEQALLDDICKEIADKSFNCVTVDGDTSTNDSFIIIATKKAGNPVIDKRESAQFEALYQCLLETAQILAKAIVRDGEGATKFMTVEVKGAKSYEEAKTVAYSISKSPLVKTAYFASDPNLGRILAAVGYASRECSSLEDLDTDKIELYLGDVLVSKGGGFASSYSEEAGQTVMDKDEITTTVILNRGAYDACVWTCDFSYDYVKINADYRT